MKTQRIWWSRFLLFLFVVTWLGTPVEAADKPRYRYCNNSATKACRQPGQGYAVCEAYLKYLNARPAEAPLPTCEVPFDPRTGFSRPQWKELEISGHLGWVYEIDKFLKKDAPLKMVADPALGVDAWRKAYEAKIKSGEIAPRLRSAILTLNNRGPVTVLAYEKDVRKCAGSVAHNWAYENGAVHFVLRDNPDKPLQPIEGYIGTHLPAEILIYRQRPYFFWISGGWGWDMGISLVWDDLPGGYQSEEYSSGSRCEFELTPKGEEHAHH